MKIFFTNLTGFDQRKAFMTKQLSDLGLSFEVIDCIDGRQWQKQDIQQIVSPRLFEMYEQYGSAWLTKGAIAATQTHVERIYKKMVAENIDYALVLEDDVRLAADFLPFFKALEQWIYSNQPTDVLLLYTVSKSTQVLQKSTAIPIHQSYRLYSPQSINMNFGGAYIIGKMAAASLLAAQSPIQRIADWWGDHAAAGVISGVRIVYPFPCSTGEFESTLGYQKKSISGFLRRIGAGKIVTALRKVFLSKKELIEIK